MVSTVAQSVRRGKPSGRRLRYRGASTMPMRPDSRMAYSSEPRFPSPDHIRTLHARLSEPGLTALVVVLCLFDFLLEPIEAMGLLSAKSVNVMGAVGMGATAFLCTRGRYLPSLLLAIAIVGAGFSILRETGLVGDSLPAELTTRGVLLAIIMAAVSSSVFGAGEVTRHRILGAIAIYLLVALEFAVFYRLVEQFQPRAFQYMPGTGHGLSGPQSLYFSFATLTTAGYGDIVALHPIARSLSNLEAVIGQLYPATIIARLITLELESRK